MKSIRSVCLMFLGASLYAGDFVLTIAPIKDIFDSGEPVIFKVELENLSREDLILPFEYPYLPWIEYDGAPVRDSGIQYKAPATVFNTKSKLEVYLVLNRYFGDKTLTSGEHTIKYKFSLKTTLLNGTAGPTAQGKGSFNYKIASSELDIKKYLGNLEKGSVAGNTLRAREILECANFIKTEDVIKIIDRHIFEWKDDIHRIVPILIANGDNKISQRLSTMVLRDNDFDIDGPAALALFHTLAQHQKVDKDFVNTFVKAPPWAARNFAIIQFLGEKSRAEFVEESAIRSVMKNVEPETFEYGLLRKVLENISKK